MAKMNEWTVMFYFAADNTLSPLIVSQLKAIKDAGYEEDTNVLVYFDSNEKRVPTRIYDVNRRRKSDPKLPKTMIGDGRDPQVRNMKEDMIDPKSISRKPGSASAAMAKALQRSDEVKAEDSLRNFIGFCRENYQARHYVLFLVGHGMIVGNDAFLSDENPVSAITLREFGSILSDFSKQARKDNGALEILALHSCSMSAIEVAFQLRGAANFMMASEGISYVGTWPYRQLLKKLFDSVDLSKAGDKKPVDVLDLMGSLYDLTLQNASDFMLSGYSLDLCLSNLAPEGFKGFKEPFQNLVKALKNGLKDKRAKELILLAHWESQSYWQEDYTDIFDFCHCLARNCDTTNRLQRSIKTACEKVMGILEPKENGRTGGLIVESRNFGSTYQYSHGLSIYFPWSEPTDEEPLRTTSNGAQSPRTALRDSVESVMGNYKKYAFTTEFRGNSWFSFLNEYFAETKRRSRRKEDGRDGRNGRAITPGIIPAVFNPFGPLNKSTGSTGTGDNVPPGVGCDCPSIKNYPTEVATINGRRRRVKSISMSEELFHAIK